MKIVLFKWKLDRWK